MALCLKNNVHKTLKTFIAKKMLIIEPSASHSINSKITNNNNEKVYIILRVAKM